MRADGAGPHRLGSADPGAPLSFDTLPGYRNSLVDGQPLHLAGPRHDRKDDIRCRTFQIKAITDTEQVARMSSKLFDDLKRM
jgi:hypothetical protein